MQRTPRQSIARLRKKADMHDTRALRRAALRALRPPPNVSISEWADKYRVLTSSQSSEPGQWETSRVEYLREPMDAFSPNNPARRIVVMKARRVGYTEGCINNVIGAWMHMAPCPIMVAQPSEADAEEWSKDSLDPMLETTPVLRGIVTSDRARAKGNTILHKRYRGGVLYAGSASTAKFFRRRLARLALGDEEDAWVGSVDGEGDPGKLLEGRVDTFPWNGKIGHGSTPTIKDASRIERLFLDSDQRHYHVPCPECRHLQPLEWERLVWTKGKPETVEYACAKCGVCIPHYKKAWMMRAANGARWVPQNPGNPTLGYLITALMSPWVTWEKLVREWEAAEGDAAAEQVFWNTSLARTWDAANAEKWDNEDLRALLEPIAVVPRTASVVTAGVDVQGDRLVFQADAWGHKEERWTLERRDFFGDPSAPEVWEQLSEALRTRYPVDGGGSMRIRATCVDTGGSHTQAAWDFCRRRRRRNVFGIKGMGGARRVWEMERRFRNKGGYAPLIVGVDTAKEACHARLRRSAEQAKIGIRGGPGFWHFTDTLDQAYFDELTAEVRVVEYSRSKKGAGPLKLRWVLRKQGMRNEALDISVYSYAALQALIAADPGVLDKPVKPSSEPATWGSAKRREIDPPENRILSRATEETKRDKMPISPPSPPATPPPKPPRKPPPRARPRVATSL